MTFKQFLLTMLVTTAAVWLVWFFLLFNIDPVTSGWNGFVFFYVALEVAMIGTLTIIGTSIRRIFRPHDLVSRQVLISFRQALWLSTIILIALFLLSFGLFYLWIISLVILFFAMIELVFLSACRRSITMVE